MSYRKFNKNMTSDLVNTLISKLEADKLMYVLIHREHLLLIIHGMELRIEGNISFCDSS